MPSGDIMAIMQFNQPILTSHAQETMDFGRQLAIDVGKKKRGDGAKIVCLYGELGSGKTTFAQGFAKGLGITKRILSPTFIIVRRYELPKTKSFFYHLDLYRLQTVEEFEELGLWEIFDDPNAFVFIEWAEKLGEMLPEHRIDFQFSVLEDGIHKILMKEY